MISKKKNIDEIKKIEIREVENNYYFFYMNEVISPWHEISLKNDNQMYNFICEIPKWTRDKFEINTKLKSNPIKQDIEDNQPRVYKWGDTIFNYGALPQTWEDPNHISEFTNLKGDGDPLDVIEIGIKAIDRCKIVPVKILGVIPLIDDNETDWKILAIAKDDILFDKLNNIKDINIHIPGLLPAIINWLIKYKSVTKNIFNKIGMNNIIQDKDFAIDIINKTHNDWKNNF